MRVLTPAWVRAREDAIAAIAHGLIDAFPASGRVRLVRDYAAPLPVAVFAQAFGVAPEDGDRFRAWADDLVRLGAGADEDENVRLAEQYVAFQRYLAARIADAPSPAGDLLSGLAAAERAVGGTVTTAELLGIGTLLLAAGNDTTTAALGSLVHRLLDDPALAAALRADRDRLPAAIEETLRLDSPLQMFQRKAVRDTELRGHAVRRGDMAMVVYGAANRDPARFPDPDAFRLDRPNPRDHLAFTQGPHHCAGAVLARAELRVATSVLLDRTADLAWDTDAEEPAAPAAFLPDLLTRAHREIPVRVTAAAGSPAA
jgi:cytochrome P450